ncbi:phage tail tape measure protein [Agromyces atrinae]|uniref:phage tail tape measure protein n=1 Tax=Agromyces atrinae TaxID=592376 RepID=UPI001F57E4F7|nr:phage tail tape measure protein [Agromyces atrinae]MCI2959553.1 phage tail tape measure protein [Agromyces atrinae]
MGFDAGALIFKIQAAGAQAAQQDLAQTEQAFAKTGRTAQTTAPKIDQVGTATDTTGKKAQAAKKPLDDQAKATEKVGDESRKAKPKQEDQAKASERQAETAQKMSIALLAAGAAVAALVTLSVVKYAEFEVGMSNVAAATMASRHEQELLGESALEAGADTAYSAREAAGAQEELAKAGLSVTDIISGGLNGALALAAAGQLEVARSAEIMATTLKVYRLPAEQAAHVSDLLAAAAGKAQGSVDDVALALDYAGIGLAQFNVPLEESIGALALFAANGILGEKAGTGLRGALAALTGPSAVGARTMAEYGVNVFDAQGKFIGLAGVAGQLQTAFADLTEEERSAAMNRIFGNESMNVANVLYKEGAEGVHLWTDEVNESGYAAEQAAMKQDNLAGDIEKLGGAFDTALIKTGSGANDVLRDMVQLVTGLVDWYGELDPAVQGNALVLGVGAASMLLFSGATLGAISKFAELRKTLEGANLTIGRTAFIAAGAGLALTGVITIVSMLAQQHAEARAKAQAYNDTLEDGTAAVTKSTREMAAANLQAKTSLNVLGIEIDAIQFDSAADAAEKLGLSLDVLTDATLLDAEAIEKVAEVTKLGNSNSKEAIELREQLGLTEGEFAAAVEIVVDAVKGENASIEEAIRLAKQHNEVTAESAPVTQTAAEAYTEAASAVGELRGELSELIDAISEANGIGQDAISANIDYRNALADVDETIAKAREGVDGYALSLDTNTQVGRDNTDMLVGLAQSAEEAARKQFDLDGNTQNYQASLEASRQALLERIHDLGLQGEEAEALADQILSIPSASEWKMIADTQEAQRAIDGFIWANDGRKITVGVNVNGPTYSTPGSPMWQADGGVVDFYANGGMREDHRAQIARAGDLRVWAEPETGGEAYIPLSPAKRSQSVPVLAEAASRLGFEIVPKQKVAPASGGGGSSTSTSAPSSDRVTIIVNPAPGMDENDLAEKIARKLRGY